MNGQFSIFIVDNGQREETHDLIWEQAHAEAMNALYMGDHQLVEGISVEIRSHVGIVFTASNPKAVEAPEPLEPVNAYREQTKEPKRWAVMSLNNLKIRQFNNFDELQTAIKMLESKQIPIEIFKYSKIGSCYTKQTRVD